MDESLFNAFLILMVVAIVMLFLLIGQGLDRRARKSQKPKEIPLSEWDKIQARNRAMVVFQAYHGFYPNSYKGLEDTDFMKSELDRITRSIINFQGSPESARIKAAIIIDDFLNPRS